MKIAVDPETPRLERGVEGSAPDGTHSLGNPGAKAEAAQELENAREELETSLRDARETLRDGSEELARLAAERILGRSLS